MKTCPRCGVENKAEKAACWNCWAPLEGPPGGAAAPRPTGRRIRLAVPWTFVAVVVLLSLAAGGTYFFFLSSKPAAVAADYLDALRNGNKEKRERLSSRQTRDQKVLPDVILIASYKIESPVTFTKGEAKVPASVQLTVDPLVIGLERAAVADAIMKSLQQQFVRADLALVKEGLNWRVDQRETRKQIMQPLWRSLRPVIRMQLRRAVLASARSAAAARPGGAAAPTKAGVLRGAGRGLAAPGGPGLRRFGMGKARGRGFPGAAAKKAPGTGFRFRGAAGGAKASAPRPGGLSRTLPSEAGEED